jgi:5-(carboxyamino)imidazole ribonucleotide mutase
VQMPGGVPVASLAIGKPGAVNAALFAVAILSLQDPAVAERYAKWRKSQAESVRAQVLPPVGAG